MLYLMVIFLAVFVVVKCGPPSNGQEIDKDIEDLAVIHFRGYETMLNKEIPAEKDKLCSVGSSKQTDRHLEVWGAIVTCYKGSVDKGKNMLSLDFMPWIKHRLQLAKDYKDFDLLEEAINAADSVKDLVQQEQKISTDHMGEKSAIILAGERLLKQMKMAVDYFEKFQDRIKNECPIQFEAEKGTRESRDNIIGTKKDANKRFDIQLKRMRDWEAHVQLHAHNH